MSTLGSITSSERALDRVPNPCINYTSIPTKTRGGLLRRIRDGPGVSCCTKIAAVNRPSAIPHCGTSLIEGAKMPLMLNDSFGVYDIGRPTTRIVVHLRVAVVERAAPHFSPATRSKPQLVASYDRQGIPWRNSLDAPSHRARGGSITGLA
ncbi:hypothetical protein O3G_MSEX010812 [Manduca sexta]|uniref:Uncharacterized protein n=1 Tax=Manduca sexta TaxID=7130 RepID=A0A921ZJT6_MANSE|nr:hypothetical protein O3G_MSEX010812 [Manduca sexta]